MHRKIEALEASAQEEQALAVLVAPEERAAKVEIPMAELASMSA
jgi:hypothetical protein